MLLSYPSDPSYLLVALVLAQNNTFGWRRVLVKAAATSRVALALWPPNSSSDGPLSLDDTHCRYHCNCDESSPCRKDHRKKVKCLLFQRTLQRNRTSQGDNPLSCRCSPPLTNDNSNNGCKWELRSCGWSSSFRFICIQNMSIPLMSKSNRPAKS